MPRSVVLPVGADGYRGRGLVWRELDARSAVPPARKEVLVMGLVKDILATKGDQVHTILGSATAYEAAERMVGCNVGSLVVMEGDKVVGIFTERDYLRRVTLTDRPPRSTAVREVMTPRIICVEPDKTIAECMAIMTQERIRHLPVAGGNEIVGMISIGDLVKHMSREQEVEIRYLTEYIQGQAG